MADSIPQVILPETDNKKPVMYDLSLFYKMGINPKTGLPIKMGSPLLNCKTKDEFKVQLRIKDMQTAVNRYKWYNLPCNLTSQEVEQFLYYNGQLCFFYDKDLDQFYFARYALEGTIDPYGRYNNIHPLPLAGGTDGNSTNKQTKQIEAVWSKKNLKVVYGMKSPDELNEDAFCKSAVILYDYTRQRGQTILPRQAVNEPLLDKMSEIFPFLSTALLTGTGIKGLRVNDADQADSVNDAARGMKLSALNGSPFVAMIGSTEFQELTDGAALKAEEFMMSYQSLDNYRLSLYGLENGGVFEKKAHTLNAEQAMNQSNTGLIYQDGLEIRQHFCNIVNSIWGCGIWCDVSEDAVGLDMDGDGVAMDENYDGAKTGVEENGGDNDNE